MREYKPLVYFGIFMILAITACFVFAFWQVDVSQHHWCDALSTLTQYQITQPPNPAANPSREQSYLLYEELLRLKDEFGCG